MILFFENLQNSESVRAEFWNISVQSQFPVAQFFIEIFFAWHPPPLIAWAY